MIGLNYIPKAVLIIVMLQTELALQPRLPVVIHIVGVCSRPVLGWDQVNSVFLTGKWGHRCVLAIAWDAHLSDEQMHPTMHCIQTQSWLFSIPTWCSGWAIKHQCVLTDRPRFLLLWFDGLWIVFLRSMKSHKRLSKEKGCLGLPQIRDDSRSRKTPGATSSSGPGRAEERPWETALVGVPRHKTLDDARSFTTTHRNLLVLIWGLNLLQNRLEENEASLEIGTEQEPDRMFLLSPNSNKTNCSKCRLGNFFWDAAMKINKGKQQSNYISKQKEV